VPRGDNRDDYHNTGRSVAFYAESTVRQELVDLALRRLLSRESDWAEVSTPELRPVGLRPWSHR